MIGYIKENIKDFVEDEVKDGLRCSSCGEKLEAEVNLNWISDNLYIRTLVHPCKNRC